MTKSTKQILIEARGLIDTPERWTKGVMHSFRGVECRCALQALAKVVPDQKGLHQSCAKQLDAIVEEYGFRSRYTGVATINYNDHPETTHADIMNLFDKAIQAADGE